MFDGTCTYTHIHTHNTHTHIHTQHTHTHTIAIAEDPDIRQYILELKGQFGKGRAVEVDEPDHSHTARTRRYDGTAEGDTVSDESGVKLETCPILSFQVVG